MKSRRVGLMIVYADILVILNLFVDFFLLFAAAKLLRKNPKTLRLLLGALAGGFGSLTVFLPRFPAFIEILIRICMCGIMTVLVFGFRPMRSFVRAAGSVIFITCLYGGIMTAVWSLFHPKGMRVIRSVVYFDISPLILLVGTSAFYLIFTLFSYIFRPKAATAQRCLITLDAGKRSITVNGFVDTGNSLEDLLSGGEVLIGDPSCFSALFGGIDAGNDELRRRYRILPCGTVSGGGTLEAYRCDSATVKTDERSVTLDKPLLAISKVPIGSEASIIVNPQIFKT